MYKGLEIVTLISLARSPWLIDKTFADRTAPVLLHQMTKGSGSLLAFKAQSQKKIDERYQKMMAVPIGHYVSAWKVKSKSNQNVAVIPIVGTLTKRGELCSYGMRDYANEIMQINDNEDIDAIVLDIDSPGGTVDGTNELGLTVKQSRKPIVAFGDQLVASAAYWIASQSRHIVGNKNNPTEFGSIGVLYVHENWSKWVEDNIGSVEIMRAKQSKDKARVNILEPLEDPYRGEVQDLLDDTADQFIKIVKKGRGDKLDTSAGGLFTGKTFQVSEALKIGMIDSVGTIGDAINVAANLAQPKENSSSKTKSMNISKKVSSFFKKPAKAAEPAAAEEDNTPMWTEDMIFNTDGSDDGAFCLHPDADGNDRKFETKIDNNQGNEPPTDPAITEDDNWSLAAAESASEEEADAEEKKEASTTVSKLNAALKKSNAVIKKLQGEVATLKKENADQKKKLEATPAGKSTTVVAESDKGHEYGKREAKYSWEQKALQKSNHRRRKS